MNLGRLRPAGAAGVRAERGRDSTPGDVGAERGDVCHSPQLTACEVVRQIDRLV